MGGIIQWLQGRRKIKDKSIAFTIGERINNKQYVEVPGVFNQTRIVQGFYEPRTGKIVDAAPPSALPDEESE